jgi:predicted NBD/HSP70 family sugar kinase
MSSESALTLTEITAIVGTSRPTVEAAVDSLIEHGWLVAEAETARRNGAGRPARRVRFRAEGGYVMSVDIGAHSTTVLLATLSGDPAAGARRVVDETADMETRIRSIESAVDDALRGAGVPDSAVLHTTIGIDAIVQRDGEVSVASVLPGFAGLHLDQVLAPYVPGRYTFINSIRSALVAERWIGAAVGCDTAVYLHAGDRMGTAYLVDGRSPHGHHGAAGELPPSAARMMLNAYRRLVMAAPDPRHADSPRLENEPDADRRVLSIDARPIFVGAARGEASAVRRVTAFTRDVIEAIDALVVTVDPEVVVIGGSLSAAGQVSIGPVCEHLAELCQFEPRVQVSDLGQDGVALGGLRVALDAFEEELFRDPIAVAPWEPSGGSSPAEDRRARNIDARRTRARTS